MNRFLAGPGFDTYLPACRFVDIQQQSMKGCFEILKNLFLNNLQQLYRERSAELSFIRLFTDQMPSQDWTVAYDDSNVTLDLPSMRVIDISNPVAHRIGNFTVVFAPRAGHHSNIAEKVALYLRDRGLTRMAIVEQKCAEDIPLHIDGKRHTEGFTSQVEQYTQVLEHLMQITGRPVHLVAICQPGPMLISSLILESAPGKNIRVSRDLRCIPKGSRAF